MFCAGTKCTRTDTSGTVKKFPPFFVAVAYPTFDVGLKQDGIISITMLQ